MNLVGGPKFDMPAIRQRRFGLDVEGHFVEDAEIFEDNLFLASSAHGLLADIAERRTESVDVMLIGA